MGIAAIIPNANPINTLPRLTHILIINLPFSNSVIKVLNTFTGPTNITLTFGIRESSCQIQIPITIEIMFKSFLSILFPK